MKKMLALGVLAMVLFLTAPVQAQNWYGNQGDDHHRQHGPCSQGYGGCHNGRGNYQAPRWAQENRHYDWQRGNWQQQQARRGWNQPYRPYYQKPAGFMGLNP